MHGTTWFDECYCFRQLATILRDTDANLSWQAIKIFNDSFLPLLVGLGGWVYYCPLVSIVAWWPALKSSYVGRLLAAHQHQNLVQAASWFLVDKVERPFIMCSKSALTAVIFWGCFDDLSIFKLLLFYSEKQQQCPSTLVMLSQNSKIEYQNRKPFM